jgi:superkiller protein 3
MPAYKFSPNLASAEERRKMFVAREAIFDGLINRVRTAESGARHCILIGPRGSGKTHILLLLADTIEAEEELSAKWVVVRFAEEEYSITSLAELLLRVIELLPEGNTKGIGRDTDLALAYVLDFCTNHKKRILLLMDNTQLYFEQFSDVDKGRLRDILMSKSAFLIIGAAPSYFKQMQGYDETFYHFFESIHLSDLNAEEAGDMICQRADFDGSRELIENFEQSKPNIATTVRLTSGNPRLILMLYQVMCESKIKEAGESFKSILDELSPYFQERMLMLSPQSRKVLDTLASMESPSTPTEIAKATGFRVQIVSSQLEHLEDAGSVRKVKLQRGKAMRYEVTERLFRMWREMRSDTGKTRLGFLIRFLNLWYTPMQLLDEAVKILTRLTETQGHEKVGLLLNLDYLKEASPELMRTGMERVYSNAEANGLDMAMAQIQPLKDLAEIEERIEQNSSEASIWVKRAIMFIEQDKLEKALESCIKSVNLDPNDANAWSVRAMSLIMLKRERASIESLNKVKELKPNDAMTYLICGSVLGNIGRYEEAFENYNKAVELKPDYAEAWYNRGLTLGNMDKYKEAFESFDKAVEFKPDYAEAWYNRGGALGNMGRHEEVFESFDKAVQIKPELTEVWVNRGVALDKLDRYDDAIESYNKAIQIMPDDAKAWKNRGVALDKLGRYDDAIESYNKAIQIMPDDAKAWKNRGVALGKLGRHEEALESFDKAIQIMPDDAKAWSNRGVALRKLGRYKEALESFDKAVQIKPDYAEAWSNRGGALVNMGKHEEAIESYDKAIKIMPDDAKAWYNRGVALVNMGKHEEALESYDKAIKIMPDYVNTWDGRGFLLAKLGRHDEALESYNKAIQIDPHYANAWLNRGILLGVMGKHDEALENLRKCDELTKAQNLDISQEYSATLSTENSFTDSLRSLMESNFGTAKSSLINAIGSGKQAYKKDFQLMLFGYFKGALKTGKFEFLKEAIDTIVKELGEDYDGLLRPFRIALDYMQTKDVGILERLQQEEREIVQEIAGER